MRAFALLCACFLAISGIADRALADGGSAGPKLSRERLVFQTDHGDIHMAFYPEVAPKTSEHIIRCGELGE